MSFSFFSKGHVTCFHAMNSVTCFASCQNFSKLMCPFGSLEKFERKLKRSESYLKIVNLLVGTTFVEEVKVFDEQREEGDDNSLTLVCGSS
jgi:hypothetical protein